MAVPARELIIADIATVLAAIATPTFKSDVTTVERLAKVSDEVPDQQRPLIGIFTQDADSEYLPGGVIKKTLKVTLVCHVAKVATEEARGAALTDLLDDIISALSADQTRGGNAYSTTLITDETDEADPFGEGSMVVPLQVRFLRTQKSS